ncbi:MAG: protein kinase [Polyangiales bacterium]
MPNLTASERLGTNVGGRYEVRRLLGEGGFSSVFEAVHTFTGREVALKILHPHLTSTEQIAERFLMEARAMARINHDSIVQVLDAGKDPDGSVFIALELLDGESLESTLLRVGRLTWGEAVSICVDVLGALSEAHRHKIIHRDIKPGNIFIVRKADGSSQAKLLDFGIAHVASVGKNKLTAQGMILGTPEYMSPEQGRTANVGPESDLWSVGIVMWECLTGHTPFVAETATEILLKIATTDAPSILDEAPELPPPVAAVIDRSLVRDVERRYRSAEEMRDAMQRAMRKTDEASAGTTRSTLRGNTPRPKAVTPGSRREASTPGRISGTAQEAARVGDAPRIGEAPRRPSGTSSPAIQAVRAPPITAVVEVSESNARAAAGMARGADPPVASVGGVPARAAAVVEVVADPRRGSGDRRVERGGFDPRAEEPAVSARPTPVTQPALREGPRTTPPLREAGQRTSDPPLTPVEAAPRAPLVSVPSTPREPSPASPPPAASAQETPLEREAPSPAGAARGGGLTFDERESRSYGGRAAFQKPPEARSPSWPLVGAGCVAAGLVAVGAWSVLHDTPPAAPPPPPPPPVVRDASAAPAPDAAPEPPTVQDLTLGSINDVPLPQGLAGADNTSEFARHAAVSLHAGTTQRMIATCVPSEGGAALFLHPLTPGALRGSARALVACNGFDLGLLPDVTNDGTDDVVAVAARRDRLIIVDSRTMQPHRTIESEGVRGVAVGGHVMVRGEPVAVVFAEPGGPGGATEVRAISAVSSRVLWRARGSERLARVGHPSELGLAVGPDADGDGVGDVVAGLGPPVDGASGATDQRCVQVFSGVDGHTLWAQPYCVAFTRSAQSVSLGPDVNGDGRGDVAVGTDHPGSGEAPAVLLSGVDGRVLRRFAAPTGELASGFGWPVTLAGDMNGNATPDLVVGSVGELVGLTVFDTSTGQVIGRLPLGGVGAGNLRAFSVPPLVQAQPWSLVVANPADGIHVYAARSTEEPL